MIVSVAELPGVIAAGVLVERVGRKRLAIGMWVGSSACTFLLTARLTAYYGVLIAVGARALNIGNNYRNEEIFY